VQLAEPVAPIERWALDPAVVHLNHGSFGGCPRDVIAVADALRARLEAAPMRFLVLDWQAELDRARAALAAFLGAPADNLAFVPNATTGAATVLASIRFTADDEVITTPHAYRAVANQLARTGARIVRVDIALPFDRERFVADVLAAVTPRTRLAVLDHITSPTAIRLPLEELVPALATRGVETLVDGAHAPGQIALDLATLGARYYTGNCHKWVCAPKGTGFLVAPHEVIPLVVSHGASAAYGPPNRFHALHDWTGTHDPTANLSVPAAIRLFDWAATIARNHALAIEFRRRFVDALGGRARVVAPDGELGSMVAIPIELPLPPLELEAQLLCDGWEIPIVDHPAGPFVRLSAHLYNYAAQADDLAAKLHSLGVRLAR